MAILVGGDLFPAFLMQGGNDPAPTTKCPLAWGQQIHLQIVG